MIGVDLVLFRKPLPSVGTYTDGSTTKYYYDGMKLAAEKKDGTIVWYDYDENGAPIGMRVNGADYLLNLQGDIVAIYNESLASVVQYTYDSWGKVLSCTGSMADTIGEYNSLRYRGYYYDSDTGLYYLNSRYYDPVLCRFVNADGYTFTDQGMTSFNMYNYCGYNPIDRIDITGTQWVGVSPNGNVYHNMSMRERYDIERSGAVGWFFYTESQYDARGVTPSGMTDVGPVYIGTDDEIDKGKFGPNDIVVRDKRHGSDPNMQIVDSYRVSQRKDRIDVLNIILKYNKKILPLIFGIDRLIQWNMSGGFIITHMLSRFNKNDRHM